MAVAESVVPVMPLRVRLPQGRPEQHLHNVIYTLRNVEYLESGFGVFAGFRVWYLGFCPHDS